jgi:hypothetical protein
MLEVEHKHAKIRSLGQHFRPLIGLPLVRAETAELRVEGHQWSEWHDPPIRLFFGEGEMVSVAWSHFEKLYLSNDDSVHFPLDYPASRWVSNSIPALNRVLDSTLSSVELGRGELAIGNNAIEIWTRLLLRFDSGWLEIFNNLDENAVSFHPEMPAGEFEKCC